MNDRALMEVLADSQESAAQRYQRMFVGQKSIAALARPLAVASGARRKWHPIFARAPIVGWMYLALESRGVRASDAA